MGKTIIMLILFLVLLPIVYAPRFDWFINPSTAKPDRSLSLNQSGEKMFVDNLTSTNITATRFTGKIDCGMTDGGSDSDYCVDDTGGSGGLPTDEQYNFNITRFFGSRDINNTLLTKDNTSFFEPFYRLLNFTFNLADRLPELFTLNNLTVALQNNSLSANFSNVSVIRLDLGWTNLTNYPIACPAGTFLTQLDDAIICTSVDTSTYFNNENASIRFGVDYANAGYKDGNATKGLLAINTSLFTKLANGSSANFTNININSINNTDLALFNKSIIYISVSESQITDLQAYLLAGSPFFNPFWTFTGNESAILDNATIVRSTNLRTALSNKTDINPQNINLSMNLSIQENMSIEWLNRTTQKIGFIEFWNSTCKIERNLISGNNWTKC